jgi:hypothetical protein
MACNDQKCSDHAAIREAIGTPPTDAKATEVSGDSASEEAWFWGVPLVRDARAV